MRLLIVEDDALVARAVVALAPADVACLTCTSRTRAEEELEDPNAFDGILIDVDLPEGPEAGLELAECLRQRESASVLAIFTGGLGDEIALRISRIGCFLLPKPFDRASFAPFFRALAHASAARAAVDDTVAHVLDELPLTTRERQVVTSVVQGRDAKTSATAMGVSESTWDTHTRSVLRKTGKKRVHQVAIDVLRRAFERARHQS